MVQIPVKYHADGNPDYKGWDNPGWFSNGLAPVRNGIHFGYIDMTGKTVIGSEFDQAEPFSEGLAAVESYGKFGYINPRGRFVIPPQFSLGEFIFRWQGDGSSTDAEKVGMT